MSNRVFAAARVNRRDRVLAELRQQAWQPLLRIFLTERQRWLAMWQELDLTPAQGHMLIALGRGVPGPMNSLAGAMWGQPTYNGVASLSQQPIHDVRRGLPGADDDDHARYIEGETGGIRVASLYLPNGNPIRSEKFPYKLSWMDRLTDHAGALL